MYAEYYCTQGVYSSVYAVHTLHLQELDLDPQEVVLDPPQGPPCSIYMYVYIHVCTRRARSAEGALPSYQVVAE